MILSDAISPKITKSKTVDLEKYEFDSNTTDQGNYKKSSQATQSQYRETQSQVHNKKGRVRKSRQHSKSAGDSSRGTPRSVEEERPTSPDPLVGDSPPLVISDLAPRGGAKRARQSSVSQPSVKRQRPTTTRHESVEDAADELAWEDKGKLTIRQADSRPAPSRSERRAPTKGDIKPTTFSSSKMNSSPRGKKEEKPFHVKRAVSGELMIESTQTERYSLEPSYGTDGKVQGLRVVCEDTDAEGTVKENASVRQDISINMSIKVDKLKNVYHHMTHSQYVVVERLAAPGQRPKLLVELSSVEECSRFLLCFSRKIISELDQSVETLFI